jgi:catechol 2,3-dioxygenase-like lactoylglutathione lyase family enzyme
MSISLNHTVVHAHNPGATTQFLAEMLGLEPACQLAHFTVLQVGPTSLDFIQTDEEIQQRHFAFLVDEAEFDRIFQRIQWRGLDYWADPFRKQLGEGIHWDDGRGVYFDDPNRHLVEAITRPYASNGCEAEHPHPLLACKTPQLNQRVGPNGWVRAPHYDSCRSSP